VLESFEAALADRADDKIGVGNGGATVGRGENPRGELVLSDVPFAKLMDHSKVFLGDIVQGEEGILQFRNARERPG